MKYFRVKKEYDNTWANGCRFLVKNELYTEKEVRCFGILPNRLIEANVNKNDTYFLFGARFSKDCGYSS